MNHAAEVGRYLFFLGMLPLHGRARRLAQTLVEEFHAGGERYEVLDLPPSRVAARAAMHRPNVQIELATIAALGVITPVGPVGRRSRHRYRLQAPSAWAWAPGAWEAAQTRWRALSRREYEPARLVNYHGPLRSILGKDATHPRSKILARWTQAIESLIDRYGWPPVRIALLELERDPEALPELTPRAFVEAFPALLDRGRRFRPQQREDHAER